MACNPCLCWNLKDGCVTVGIWSLILSLGLLGLFGWQMNTMNACRTMLIAGPNQQCQEYCPCTSAYQGQVQQIVEALFVVQILALIAAFFLLFASVALIYGIHTNSRHLVWPWFPCMIAVTLCSIAYCIIWWTGEIRDYWLVLTIIQILTVIVNIYCILCVVTQYRRIVRGIAEPDYYYRQYQPKDQIIYSNGPGGETRTKIQEDFYYPEHETKNQAIPEGQWNPAYADADPYNNVQLYTHPVQELPPKTPLGDSVEHQTHQAIGPIPEKAQFTEQWLDHLAESINEIPRQVSEPTSPTKLEMDTELRPAKSYPSIRPEITKEERRRHEKRHRSLSVGSRSRRSHKSSRSSSGSENRSYDSDDDQSRRTKSSRRRHHRSHSRDKYSDADTGYSRSEHGDKRRHRHHHHSHSSKRGNHRSKDRDEERDRDRDRDKSKRSKRPRDVKREDKERLEAKNEPPIVPPRPGSTGTDLNSWPPKYSPAPSYPGVGSNAAITIPQHIVIPPNIGKNGQPGKPQRFHINSEITISYSDRSTAPPSVPSDTEAVRKGGWEPRITPISGPTVTSPTDAEDGEPTVNRRSYGAESSDSKGYGSTAV